MSDIGYLRGRLPALTLEAKRLPIGPEEFTDLILGAELKSWAGGLLDWFRLANLRSEQRRLPRPFPDASIRPVLAWPDDPWGAYYRRFGSIAAPPLIRDWALEDSALLSTRGAINGRGLGLPSRPPHPRLDGLLPEADPDTEAAAKRDAKTMAFFFQWLDQRLYASGSGSLDWIYGYALKLLILIRNGRRLEHREAA